MSLFTIFGGNGFIGSEFIKYIQKQNQPILIPEKNSPDIFDKHLGTIIYSIGSGDCIKSPFNVLDANTIFLSKILQEASFDKLIYISSTRLYINQEKSTESSDLLISSNDTRRLFNLTKLVSEELCIKSNKNVTIIRPSNVYGPAINSPLFLPSIVRDAINKKCINMYVKPDYEKDYIAIEDLINCTLQLTKIKKNIPNIINIASGYNTTAKDITQIIKEKTGCTINWHTEINDIEKFPPIDISYIKENIDLKPRNVLHDLSEMIDSFKLSIKI